MKQKVLNLAGSGKLYISHHKKLIIILAAGGIIILVGVVTLCNLLVETDKKYVLPSNSGKHVRVGIVLGAGITKQGKPYKELQARLDSAAAALNKGQVDKLILSGDNRFKNYDEPSAMKKYLVDVKRVDPKKLQPDFAGRSTYESCERASRVFGVKQAIIYSAGSHLPRAIYLCRHFGIEAYGVSSGVEANNSTRHELLARTKAVFNIYIYGERTVLGPAIKV